MTTPTDDLAQALRELAANWRRHADKMYFAAHANRVRECADELDATVAAHESRAQPASVPDRPVPTPISAGEVICNTYGYDQVVIMARKVGDGGIEHVTTYGVNKVHCDVAARMGYMLKYKIMGWDERSADPSESRQAAQPASSYMLPASIMRQFRRAIEEAKNRKGMRVGLPKVEVDANNFEGLLDRYEAACTTQPASVSDGWVIVPRILAEQVQDSLGRFTGDEGPMLIDYQIADALGSCIPAAPQPLANDIPQRDKLESDHA